MEPSTNAFETKPNPLAQQLTHAGIDLSLWGTGEAKTLADLQKEIDCGETELVTQPSGELLRQVVVGKADIYYTDANGKQFRLKEEKQLFKDGRERRRDYGAAVLEKMKPGENPAKAMVRGIQEELGLNGDISVTPTGTEEETNLSPSYPGLPSRYVRHAFQVQLSDDQFNPAGYIENQSDKSTYFVWEQR